MIFGKNAETCRLRYREINNPTCKETKPSSYENRRKPIKMHTAFKKQTSSTYSMEDVCDMFVKALDFFDYSKKVVWTKEN